MNCFIFITLYIKGAQLEGIGGIEEFLVEELSDEKISSIYYIIL